MKSKQKKRSQVKPVGRSYSLFLSPDERSALEAALLINSLKGRTSKKKAKENVKKAKENVIRWADQVRSRAVFLQMVLDRVLTIRVTGQRETDFHFFCR